MNPGETSVSHARSAAQLAGDAKRKATAAAKRAEKVARLVDNPFGLEPDQALFTAGVEARQAEVIAELGEVRPFEPVPPVKLSHAEKIRADAAAWHAAGFVTLPLKTDGSKSPAVHSWTDYQTRLPNDVEHANWFGPDREGLYLVMGAASGHAEMFEFEGLAYDGKYVERMTLGCQAVGLGDVWARIWNGYRERTPSGGVHLMFRVIDGETMGNTKLTYRSPTAEEFQADWAEAKAQAAARLTVAAQEGREPTAAELRGVEVADSPKVVHRLMMETRGAGGGVAIAPSSGACHPTGHGWTLEQGTPGTVPTITCRERDAIYAVAVGMSSKVAVKGDTDGAPREAKPASVLILNPFGPPLSPAERFEVTTDWSEILEPHGWTEVFDVKCLQEGQRAWLRPGKAIVNGKVTGGTSRPLSATTGGKDKQGKVRRDRMYSWSSSGVLDDEKEMTKGYVHAKLNFGGDMKAAFPGHKSSDTAGPGGQGDETGGRYLTGRTCDEFGRVEGEPLDALMSDPAFPMFARLRQGARNRGTSPVAVIGVHLVRILTAIPIYVVTPPIVGGHGSPNSSLCLVGRAGMSKGASMKAAKAIVPIEMQHTANGIFVTDGEVYSPKIGSGQGVAAQFAYREKPQEKTGAPGKLVRERDAVLFTCNEVSDMTAKSQGNSTLLATVCEMWMGESLGSSYVDPTKRLPIEEMTYRACFILHAQPDLLGPLLIDAAPTGAPQRFLYLPVQDLWRPDNKPDFPEVTVWKQPGVSRLGGDRWHEIWVCPAAEEAIDDHNARMHAGVADPLDGHLLFGRLKFALAIDATRGRLSVSCEAWTHSAALMDISRATRDETVAHLRALGGKKATATREQAVLTARATTEAVEETKVDGLEKKTLAVVRWLDGEAPKNGSPGAAGKLKSDWVRFGELSVLVPKSMRAAPGTPQEETPLWDALARLVHYGLAETRTIEEPKATWTEYRKC